MISLQCHGEMVEGTACWAWMATQDGDLLDYAMGVTTGDRARAAWLSLCQGLKYLVHQRPVGVPELEILLTEAPFLGAVVGTHPTLQTKAREYYLKLRDRLCDTERWMVNLRVNPTPDHLKELCRLAYLEFES